jgi:hypothetical protein
VERKEAVLEQRRQELALVQQVRLAAQEQALVALRRILQLRLDRQDLLLRRCQPAEFAAVQARAQILEELLRELFDSAV